MPASTVVASLALLVCLVSRARGRRGDRTVPLAYPPLAAAPAAVARALLVAAGLTVAGAGAWALGLLATGSWPGPALAVVLVGCAVGHLVRGWRRSQARMVWSDAAERPDPVRIP